MVSARNGSKIAASASPRIDVSLLGLGERKFSAVDKRSMVAEKVSGKLETEKEIATILLMRVSRRLNWYKSPTVVVVLKLYAKVTQ